MDLQLATFEQKNGSQNDSNSHRLLDTVCRHGLSGYTGLPMGEACKTMIPSNVSLTSVCSHQQGSIQRCPALSLASLGGGSGSCPYSYANSWPNPHRSSTRWWCKWGLWGPKPKMGYKYEKQKSHELLWWHCQEMLLKNNKLPSSKWNSQFHSRDLHLLVCVEVESAGLKTLGSPHHHRCSVKILTPRSVSLPDLVQAPSKFTIFKCGPRWVIIFSSDMRACFSLDLAVAVEKINHVSVQLSYTFFPEKANNMANPVIGNHLFTKRETVPWSRLY